MTVNNNNSKNNYNASNDVKSLLIQQISGGNFKLKKTVNNKKLKIKQKLEDNSIMKPPSLDQILNKLNSLKKPDLTKKKYY